MSPRTVKSTAAHVSRSNAVRELGSPPRKVVRIVVCAALSLFALIGSAGWAPKLFFVATMVVLCGSWRRFKFGEKSAWNRWTIGFVQLPARTVKYRQFDYIEIVHQQPTGIVEFVLFGPIAFLLGWVANTFAPGAAGSYQLWLNTLSDDRELVWQGSTQAEFEEALEALQLASEMRTKTR
ncbi:MAG: hypothetical protein KDA75_15530 [Planctomycetaceae bacterium]|nr:hypothetical protein [Planctomycetaceae bacterium]